VHEQLQITTTIMQRQHNTKLLEPPGNDGHGRNEYPKNNNWTSAARFYVAAASGRLFPRHEAICRAHAKGIRGA
jgi:hypothetical protein